jgi:hypothetical protein
MANITVKDYEVFRNERNALAFFFHHQPELALDSQTGPFWFTIEGDSIQAGVEGQQIVFAGVRQDILAIARQRGVLMMMEFEGQAPVRCTPCYLSGTFEA